jgi:aspartyl-tRNA(Asn)/glutamyl-tRNA(Gln) amidotransferase subunit A
VPVAVKDSFSVHGLGRRLGLVHREVSATDAVAVARLRALGAVIVGKTAMDQLAWTMTGLAPGMPTYESPAVRGHLPGGSSGGAAASVGLNIVPLALASDSAGSIRLPAAWCGVTGFKPTHGTLPSDGCAPLAPEFDTVGLIARDAQSIARAFAAMTGRAVVGESGKGRIGIPFELLDKQTWEPDAAAAWLYAEERLKLGAESVVKVTGRFRAPGMDAMFAAALAARWSDAVERQPSELVEPSVSEGLTRGREIAGEDLLRAHRALVEEKSRAAEVFNQVDLLALPTASIRPPKVGSKSSVAAASALTRPWSAYGWPAVSIPIPGHPGMGLQLVGRNGRDASLLTYANQIELALRS